MSWWPKRSRTGGLGVKKLYWYTTFGRIEAVEPLWRIGTDIERPFSALAGVRCRGSSLPLQRVMADFGADAAFGRVPDKLKEHYGIEMPVSTIRRTTEQHAQRIYEQEAVREIGPGTAAGVIFVGELDGSMVPVMEPAPEAEDKRKGKVLSWKEVRLNLVHPNGGVTPVFGGILPVGSRKAAGSGGGVRRKPDSDRGVTCTRSAMAHLGSRTRWSCNLVRRAVTWGISSISVSISAPPPQSVPQTIPGRGWTGKKTG